MIRLKINTPAAILLCLFFCICGKAQELSFQHIGTDTGLPATEVYNLFQDSQGYICAATEYGLVKYNGSRFMPVCTNIPLRKRIIYAVYKNPEGQIFLANSMWEFYAVRNDSAFLLPGSGLLADASKKKHPVGSFCVRESGDVWVNSQSGTFEYSHSSGKVTALKLPAEYDTVRQRIELRNNWFHICGGIPGALEINHPVYGGLYALHGLATFRHSVFENKNGLYMLLRNALVRITADRKIIKYNIPATGLTMSRSPDDHILAGVLNEGLYELDKDLGLLHHYLPDCTVTDILFDTSGGLWVSTLERGIFHCRNIHEYNCNNLPGLDRHISMIRQIRDKLFIGTAAGALLVTDTAIHTISLPHDAFARDAVYWRGVYYVGTRSGIYSISPDLTKAVRCHLYCNYAFALRDDSLLISLNDALGGMKRNMHMTIHAVHAPRINSIVWRDGAACYLGTEKGILLFSSDTISCPGWLLPLRESRVRRMVRDSAGTIWACTTGDGLYTIEQDSMLRRVPAPADVITDICFLPAGRMLLSANTGLFLVDKAHSGSTARRVWAGEVTQATCYRDKIYIGTKQGLVVLDTAVLGMSSEDMPVYLHALTSKGKELPVRDIQTRYFQNDLYFSFDVLCYNGNRPVIYYTLSGPTATEGIMTGTQVHLQNLDPGRYSLRLYSGEGRKELLAVPFFIKPAFWQTPVFRLLASLGAITLLLCVVWLIINSMRRKEKRKQIIRRLLSEYKLTALKAQINPHFISNSLTAIHQLVLSGETDAAGQYLAKFSLLIRYVLQYSDKSLALLADELKVVALNISLEQLRFRNHFIYEENIAPDIDMNALYIPPLITQPIIENAIWHGLLRLKNSRRPRLLFAAARKGGSLIITIEDNGVGRQATTESQMPGRASRGASHGLSLTRSRIYNLNQLYGEGCASMEITDLFSEGAPAGTRIDIILPIITSYNYGQHYHQEYHY